MKRNKLFYGWVIVLLGILIMGVSYGVVLNGISLYLKPVTEDLGFLRSEFSVCHSLITLAIMLSSLFSGRVFRRFRPLNVMKAMAVVMPAAYYLFLRSTRLWQFYLTSAVGGVCISYLTILPYSVILTNWFIKKRGLAIGFGLMGTGIGGMVFNALGGRAIEAFGWRAMAPVMPVLMAVVVIPCVFFLIKERPEDMGLRPLGWTETSDSASSLDRPGLSREEVYRTGRFKLMIPVAFMIGFTTTILCTNVVAHVSDVGFTPLYAAGLTSACFGALAAGKIVLGRLVDALGVQKACFLACVAIFLGTLGLFLAAHRVFHVLIVLGNFLGGPCGTVSYPLLAQAIFGRRAYVEINGVLTSMNFLGAACAPYISNLIYDATASYNAAFAICLAMAVLAGAFYLQLKPVADL